MSDTMGPRPSKTLLLMDATDVEMFTELCYRCGSLDNCGQRAVVLVNQRDPGEESINGIHGNTINIAAIAIRVLARTVDPIKAIKIMLEVLSETGRAMEVNENELSAILHRKRTKPSES